MQKRDQCVIFIPIYLCTDRKGELPGAIFTFFDFVCLNSEQIIYRLPYISFNIMYHSNSRAPILHPEYLT